MDTANKPDNTYFIFSSKFKWNIHFDILSASWFFETNIYFTDGLLSASAFFSSSVIASA